MNEGELGMQYKTLQRQGSDVAEVGEEWSQSPEVCKQWVMGFRQIT